MRGSLHGGSSTHSRTIPASGPRAFEAHLLSEATRTAVIAARSILISGGSEDVALRTAKAAAESVLNPTGSDCDTMSGRSGTFLRRRKAKRQAEVVASMALMNAVANIRDGQSVDWSVSSNGGGASYMNPYTRNITTRSMNTQDEPSVLSGSSRPPRIPAAEAGDCLTPSLHSRLADHNQFMTNEKLATAADTMHATTPRSGPRPPRAVGHTSPAATAMLSRRIQQPDATPSISKPVKPVPPHTPNSPRMAVSQKSDTEPAEFNFPLDSVSSDADGTDVDTMASSVITDSTEGLIGISLLKQGKEKTRTMKGCDSWSWDSVSGVLNILTCGPVSASLCSNTCLKSNGKKGKRTQHRSDETATSFTETIDDRDDNVTDYRSMPSYDTDSDNRDITDGVSSRDNSEESIAFLRELHSASASEGDIQVLNSIRDSMENIVSRSKHSRTLKFHDNIEWKSYEIKEAEEAARMANDESFSTKPLKQKKLSTFFKRRTPTKRPTRLMAEF